MALQIGVIGVGGLGYLQAKTYRELGSVEIVAAADITADARDLFEREFHAPAYETHRALLHEHAAELDAVTIVTPHTLHYDQAMACLDRGLHVLVEKPMVTDVGNAKTLVQTATERDLVLQVGYQRRFHEGFREIDRLLGSGRIGHLHSVNCFVSQNWIDNHRGTWRVDPSLSGGGQLYDTGSHVIDTLLWLTHAHPTTVSAQIEYAMPDIDVNSVLTIGMERDDQPVLASVAIVGDGVDLTPREGYRFWGTSGSISYMDDELVVTERDGATYRTEMTIDADFDALNRRKLRNFADAIEGTAESAVPGTVGLTVTAVTEAAYQAAASGSTVSVQSIIDGAAVEQ
ncbi:Gfo/Idh/MocA family protein [Halorientalis halophila]|uniref:Gfo/Idh/MocA family protein n=1 Tax=Halorientalis halophila TaxID=3108499 RepID=UPI003008D4B3